MLRPNSGDDCRSECPGWKHGVVTKYGVIKFVFNLNFVSTRVHAGSREPNCCNMTSGDWQSNGKWCRTSNVRPKSIAGSKDSEDKYKCYNQFHCKRLRNANSNCWIGNGHSEIVLVNRICQKFVRKQGLKSDKYFQNDLTGSNCYMFHLQNGSSCNAS